MRHREIADWCVKLESCRWCWHMPIKQWGAQGRRAVCKLYSFIQDGRSPCGATSPVPYHLYANKSLLNSIPIRVPQDKHVLLYKGRLKKKNLLCSSNVGSCFLVTQELIKLDSLWMLSPSCCLCKQLVETERFNGRLWLQLIRCTHSANSLFHCFQLWFLSHICSFLTTWQLNRFFLFYSFFFPF